MKTIKLLFASLLVIAFTQASAQEKSEQIKVAGECGMCKKKIEKAAKSAGATFAEWDKEAKVLAVRYNANGTSKMKIENAVAKTGYDTENVQATNAAYEKLDDCCKYERTGKAKDHKCDENCMKDGKCTHDMADGKGKGCDMKNCSKKA